MLTKFFDKIWLNLPKIKYKAFLHGNPNKNLEFVISDKYINYDTFLLNNIQGVPHHIKSSIAINYDFWD